MTAPAVVEAIARVVAPRVAALLYLGRVDDARRRLQQIGGSTGVDGSWDVRGRSIHLHQHPGLRAAEIPRPWVARIDDVFAWMTPRLAAEGLIPTPPGQLDLLAP